MTTKQSNRQTLTMMGVFGSSIYEKNSLTFFQNSYRRIVIVYISEESDNSFLASELFMFQIFLCTNFLSSVSDKYRLVRDICCECLSQFFGHNPNIFLDNENDSCRQNFYVCKSLRKTFVRYTNEKVKHQGKLSINILFLILIHSVR